MLENQLHGGCRLRNQLAWATFTLLFLVGPIWAGGDKSTGVDKPADAQLAHGKYLVNNVAGCNDCHTPFTDKGIPDETRYLQGAPLMFKPTVDMPWATVAPPIAGLPTLPEKDAVEFLMTGKLPAGRHLRPPMPPYRLKKADAEAVV